MHSVSTYLSCDYSQWSHSLGLLCFYWLFLFLFLHWWQSYQIDDIFRDKLLSFDSYLVLCCILREVLIFHLDTQTLVVGWCVHKQEGNSVLLGRSVGYLEKCLYHLTGFGKLLVVQPSCGSEQLCGFCFALLSSGMGMKTNSSRGCLPLVRITYSCSCPAPIISMQ